MRLERNYELTEHHRYIIYRDFSLGSVDLRMLSEAYLPMVGRSSFGLFHTLQQQIPADSSGHSEPVAHHKLFRLLGIQPHEQGRQGYMEDCSRLEAVGLLVVTRRVDPTTDEAIYRYSLQRPLSPFSFFRNQHLVLLLRDQIGKSLLLELKDKLMSGVPLAWSRLNTPEENLTTPFYEWFKLNPQGFDEELDSAEHEITAAHMPNNPEVYLDTVNLDELLRRTPHDATYRRYIEEFQKFPNQLAELQFLAYKYDLETIDLCRLLDEDGAFDRNGMLQAELLEKRARLLFQQDRQRRGKRAKIQHKLTELPESNREVEVEVPEADQLPVPTLLLEVMDLKLYNTKLRNEPYTKAVSLYFRGEVPDKVYDMLDKFAAQYRMPDEVLNVLMHYLHTQDLPWSPPYVETIVGKWLGHGVDCYAKAVALLRKDEASLKRREQSKQNGSGNGRKKYSGTSQKPSIPVVQPNSNVAPVSEEELAQMIAKVRMRREKITKGEEQ